MWKKRKITVTHRTDHLRDMFVKYSTFDSLQNNHNRDLAYFQDKNRYAKTNPIY